MGLHGPGICLSCEFSVDSIFRLQEMLEITLCINTVTNLSMQLLIVKLHIFRLSIAI